MKSAFLFITAAVISIFCVNALAAADSAESLKVSLAVEKFTLNNGLTVLLREDHNIPMISYHTWYRVGSRDEHVGVTGAAHMLEHMMFKGAQKYSGKQFDQILHENGIQNNAFTTSDYTGFYENLPSDKLELIMDLEVDRMRSLAIAPAELVSELQVVGEERRWRVDNNPVSLLREAMMGSLYQTHPYHWPVIGYMSDIQQYTSDKLRAFYQTYYVPNNAVIVIAGDFNPQKVRALVEKYYSQLAAKPLPPRVYPPEPDLTAPRQVNIKSEVQNTTVLLAYKTVALGNPDQYPLDLAANILGAGASSRLYKRLVYKMQETTSVGASSETPADPGYFMLYAALKPGKSSKLAEKVLAEEISKLRTTLISGKELEKAKNIVMKEYVDGLLTIDSQAQSLAVSEILRGDYHVLFDDLGKYQAVTVADIQRVMKQYCRPDRLLTAVLDPKK